MKFNTRQKLHTQTPHTILIVEPNAPHFRFVYEHITALLFRKEILAEYTKKFHLEG